MILLWNDKGVTPLETLTEIPTLNQNQPHHKYLQWKWNPTIVSFHTHKTFTVNLSLLFPLLLLLGWEQALTVPGTKSAPLLNSLQIFMLIFHAKIYNILYLCLHQNYEFHALPFYSVFENYEICSWKSISELYFRLCFELVFDCMYQSLLIFLLPVNEKWSMVLMGKK